LVAKEIRIMSFAALERIAEQRQKKDYSSTKRWAGNTDLIGVCGEKIVSIATGLPMDEAVRPEGDAGYDFVHNGHSYDVKATQYDNDPHLLEFPDKDIVADVLVLVYVNVDERYGKILGWATRGQMISAPLKDLGHGAMRAIRHSTLLEWGQDGLPPELEHQP